MTTSARRAATSPTSEWSLNGRLANNSDIPNMGPQSPEAPPEKANDADWSPLALSEAQKRILRSHVHDALRLAIIGGRYPENERLNERQLATEFGVSTTPLEEAFRQLEAEGLIDTLPCRGVRVRLGRTCAEEMIFARSALESTIAGVAAERITSEQTRELRQVLRRLKKASAGTDIGLVMQLSAEYHNTIRFASSCQHLTRLVEQQRFVDVNGRRFVHSDVAERAVAFKEHKEIARAIIAERPEEAERLMRWHFRRSGVRYLTQVFVPAGLQADDRACAERPEQEKRVS